jgi:hypothetical protein
MTVDGADDAALASIGLATKFPLLAAEWHPTLNGDRVAASVTAGAKLRAFWLCPSCSHVWQAGFLVAPTAIGAPSVPVARPDG